MQGSPLGASPGIQSCLHQNSCPFQSNNPFGQRNKEYPNTQWFNRLQHLLSKNVCKSSLYNTPSVAYTGWESIKWEQQNFPLRMAIRIKYELRPQGHRQAHHVPPPHYQSLRTHRGDRTPIPRGAPSPLRRRVRDDTKRAESKPDLSLPTNNIFQKQTKAPPLRPSQSLCISWSCFTYWGWPPWHLSPRYYSISRSFALRESSGPTMLCLSLFQKPSLQSCWKPSSSTTQFPVVLPNSP